MFLAGTAASYTKISSSILLRRLKFETKKGFIFGLSHVVICIVFT